MKTLSLKAALLGFLSLSAVLAGCGSPATPAQPAPSSGAGKMLVVAAENFWGSIAAQLGGDRVAEVSIISNPNTDPHDYEPTPADARAMASARMALINGIGYDAWATKLVDANPVAGQVVLNVGDLTGVKVGGNPHRWYSPPDVYAVIDRITASYKQLDPAGASYFDAQRNAYLTKDLASYSQLISAIRAKYGGTPVGASESIFVPLAQSLGLKLITPDSFLNAVSQGSDPTAADKTAIDAQIRNHEIKVYVYNSQNATPDVQTQVDAARAAGIPVTTITETLAPAGATFQQWQTAQLQALQAALAKATAA